MRALGSLLRHLPLTTGPTPWLLALLAAAALLAALWRRTNLAWAAVAAVAAAAATATVRALLPGSVDVARIPTSFYVWTAVPLATAMLVAKTWRQQRWRIRAVGVVAVLATLLFGLDQVNVWFAYYPTAADLVGAPLPHQTTLSALQLGQRISGEGGQLVELDLAAPRSGFHPRRGFVWLPPGMGLATSPTTSSGRGVVMALAGTPGAPDDMLRAGNLSRVAAAYAKHHPGQAPIIVFPDHNGSFTADSECVGDHGEAETYLTEDVPDDVAALFGVRRSGWGVIGYSEGGTCAVMLSLRHRDLFGAFVDIAGDRRPNLGRGDAAARQELERLYGGDTAEASAHDPLTLLQTRRYDGMAGWFIAGRSDPPALDAQRALAPAARAAGVAVQASEVHGHHSFAMVNAITGDAFGWLADQRASQVPA